MPEMRGKTEREAKRKGIAGRIEPGKPHVSTRKGEPEAPVDPTGSEDQPDPATREEHLRSDGRLKGGAPGGPS